MIDFLITYWKEILDVLILIGAVVLYILKKKPVNVLDTIKEVIIELLPLAINKAEESGAAGSDKKVLAAQYVFDALKILGYGAYPELKETYGKFIDEKIEVILSTPQKKGD